MSSPSSQPSGVELSSDPLALFDSETAPVVQTRGSRPSPVATVTFGYAQDLNVQLDNQRPSRGHRLWSVVAVSLVSGILVGFGTGYVTAQRLGPTPASARWTAPPESASTRRATESAQPLSEANVAQSTSGRLNPDPIAAPPMLPASAAPIANAVRRVPAVPPGQGSIEVLSRPPGAQVLLDGRVVGQTPLSIPNLPEGTHDVRVELPGFNRWETSVRVRAGGRTRLGASLEPAKSAL